MRIYLVHKGAQLQGVHRDKLKAQAAVDRLARLGRDVSDYSVTVKSIKRHELKDYLARAMKR